MSSTRLRLVVSNPQAPNPCSCRTWGLLRPTSRDFILHDLMQWASLLHQVELKLLARAGHVEICDLLAMRPEQGRVRRVMTELCSWADCARVILELSPADHWGSNTERLTRFYQSLGFEANHDPGQPILIQEAMIRYPVRERGHVRL